MAEASSSGLAQICSARGIRIRNRGRAVLQVMDAATDLPSLEDIHARARALDSKVSLSTVYRTVRDLANAGALDRLDLGDGRARFEKARGDNQMYFHLVDGNTGAVVEFYNLDVEDAIRNSVSALGYKLSSLRLKVVGEARPNAEAVKPSGNVKTFARHRKRITAIAILLMSPMLDCQFLFASTAFG